MYVFYLYICFVLSFSNPSFLPPPETAVHPSAWPEYIALERAEAEAEKSSLGRRTSGSSSSSSSSSGSSSSSSNS